MGRFITKLDVELTDDDNGIWKITSPFIYQSDTTGTQIVVPVGFLTDFASVPRIPIIFETLGDIAHSAAVIHDWLYSSNEVSRNKADLVLKEAMKDTGVPLIKRQLIYSAVRMFGGSRYDVK